MNLFLFFCGLFHVADSNQNTKLYGTIILPVVLYGCETRSLTLREEHRLRVFENRVKVKLFLCLTN
jgi:hypothetical protein